MKSMHAPGQPSETDAEEIRELQRYAAAIIGVTISFAVLAALVVLETRDAASGVAAIVLVSTAILLVRARRSLGRGSSQRAGVLMVVTTLITILVLASIPPPVPAMGATPLLAVGLALGFLRGRSLVIALVAASCVAVATATIVQFVPDSEDLPLELAAILEVGTMAAVVGVVSFILYRHRSRLTVALARANDAGEALHASEERYRTIVEDVRDVIFRIDSQGRWTLLNPAWTELTGYPVDASLGQTVASFLDPDDRIHHVLNLRRLVDGTVDGYRHEFRLRRHDETFVWVDVHGRAMSDEASGFVGISGTITDITERRNLEARLVDQAFHDDLTGLANRALFKDRLEHALVRQARGPDLVAVLFLDIDRFKIVNDSLGHAMGDELLTAVAGRLQGTLRHEDTVARLGGDEFAILIEQLRSPDEAIAGARRVEAVFDAPFQIAGRDITIASSIGLVVASSGDRTGDELIRDADVAMYQAKVAGQGSFALFEPAMQAEIAARMELETELRKAIEGDGLSIAYQPIVTLTDGEIVGVEALARWSHPRRGNLPPAIFIPGAEASNLIVPLGRWVLRRACQDVADLRRTSVGAANLRLSVNVSPMHLVDASIVSDVMDALGSAGLPADALQLEVTESVVLDHGHVGLEHVLRLRADGVRVSLDDFGTGYSSLGNLRSLPIDELKVDRTFVDKLLAGGAEAVIVDAVVRLGAALGIDVVAEGIETPEVAARLALLGCPLGQGYLFGRPQPILALAASIAGQVEARDVA